MGTMPPTKSYGAYVALWVGLILSLPLWREFHEPGQPLWNAFLGVFLVALVGGAFLGRAALAEERHRGRRSPFHFDRAGRLLRQRHNLGLRVRLPRGRLRPLRVHFPDADRGVGWAGLLAAAEPEPAIAFQPAAIAGH